MIKVHKPLLNVKQLLLMTVLILIFLFLNTGTAKADYVGPAYSSLTPAAGTGVTQTNSDDIYGYNYIVASAVLNDVDGIKESSISMTVVGTFDGFNTMYVPISANQGIIYYFIYGPLPNSQFTVNLNAKDINNRYSSCSWSFYYDTVAPNLSISPANYSGNNLPTITVQTYDTLSGIDTTGTTMKIDNSPVPITTTAISNIYNPKDGKYYSGYNITYNAKSPLASGNHLVEVTVRDKVGLTQTGSMAFTGDPPTLNWVPLGNNGYINSFPVARKFYDPYLHIWCTQAAVISAIVEDPEGIDPNSVTATYGLYNNCEKEYIPLSPTKGQINLYIYDHQYNGNYTANFSVKDNQNNLTTAQCNFTVDTNPPTISANVPTGNVESFTPTLSASLSDSLSGIDPASIVMKLDNTAVTPALTANGSGYNISYTPPAALSVGQHNVEIDCKDKAGSPASKNWSFTVTNGNVGPTITGTSPENNTNPSINPFTQAMNFSASFYDYDGIKSANITIKFPTGETYNAAPSIIYDSADQKNAHISYDLCNYPNKEAINCEYTIVVQDNLGVSTTQTTYFNVKKDIPWTMDLTPVNGTKNSNQFPVISAVVKDMTGIDPNSIVMTIDGSSVLYNSTVFTSSYGNGYTVSYTPLEAMSIGTHSVELTYKDLAGNQGITDWSFTVETPQPPEFTSVTPGPNGIGTPNYYSNKLDIIANVSDDDGLVYGSQSMTIKYSDGTSLPVAASLSFIYGSTISAQVDLPEGGPYEVTATVQAKNGLSATKTWSFMYCRDYPGYTLTGPTGNYTDPQSSVTTTITDTSSGINPASIVMKVDGNVVNPTLIPYGTGYTVSYQPAGGLAVNTSHTFEVSASDNLGFTKNNLWSAYTSSKPMASNITPAPGSSVQPEDPNISIHFTDPNGFGIYTMTLDGRRVYPNITLSNNNQDVDITYKNKLSSGPHNVSVSAQNNKNIQQTQNWQFTINGFKDMDYMSTGNDACDSCHGGTVTGGIAYSPTDSHSINFMPNPASKNFDDIHSIEIADYHENNCFNCHGNSGLVVTPGRNKCDLCHSYNQPMVWQWNLLYAGPNPFHSQNTYYVFQNHNNPLLYTITSPRRSADCSYCHEQPYTTTPKFANHDIIGGHKVNFPDASCQQCHNNILTREHAADGHTDANGHAMTCNTCHNSSISTVQSAIPNYQPLRYKIFQALGVSGLTSLTSEEYAISGKQITGARLTTYSDLKGSFHVQGYWNGSWHDIYVKSMKDNYTVNSPPTPSPLPFQTPTSVNITFPRPADKVRIYFDNFYTSYISTRYRAEAKLDQWQVTPGDSITCTSCHPQTSNHAAAHTTGFDSRCTTCHDTNLMTEHVDKRSKTCASCHQNTNPKYGQAIAFKQQNCSDCHNNGHGLSFAASVPADIPLNPSFTWSPPQAAKLYTGEPWIPQEFIDHGGMVAISNRVNTVTGDSVWSWYKDNMLLKGWAVSSSEPTAGSNFYNVTFTKGTAKAVLWFYGGPNHSSGPVPASGYRVELIYHS